LYRFLAITILLDVKDIPQVGPLQWGRISNIDPDQNSGRQAMTMRLPFFVATGPIVLATSSIKAPAGTI